MDSFALPMFTDDDDDSDFVLFFNSIREKLTDEKMIITTEQKYATKPLRYEYIYGDRYRYITQEFFMTLTMLNSSNLKGHETC